MEIPFEEKLVVAVSSRALFNLDRENEVFEKEGVTAYEKYQEEHQYDVLGKGVAFPFIRRLLKLNDSFPERNPVEVVLLSRNDPFTGLRVFNSIQSHKLNITNAGFVSGKSPFKYIQAFNASLFLSANKDDVEAAIANKLPGGLVISGKVKDDDDDNELRVAFDFDCVLTDDDAEQVYQKGGIEAFKKYEQEKVKQQHPPGLLHPLLVKLSQFQQMEEKKKLKNPEYSKVLRIAIVTARNAPSHMRMVNTLTSWGVKPDETFFLGKIPKSKILNTMQPHIFFDDQLRNLKAAEDGVPSVHIPFGITNNQDS